MLRRAALLGLVWSSSSFAGVGSEFRHAYHGNGHYLLVEALRDDVLHLEIGAGAGDTGAGIYTTPMVAKTDFAGPSHFVADERHVETASLSAVVDGNLCVKVRDLRRQVDLQTVCPDRLGDAWKGLTIDSPATRNVYGLGQYFAEENTDGDWLGRVWDPLSDGYGARLRGFAGGANDYSMFPIMYALGDGTQNYGFFLDQIYKQMWDFRASPWRLGMWGDQIRWYVLQGDDLPALRRSYMELTGKPPVPPKRSFGLWVSEFGFQNWGEVDATLAGLRQAHFPVDGFALDLQWFGGTFGDPDHSRMGSLGWDERNFPNPRGKVASLAADGVNLMLIEEPYISRTLDEYQSLEAHGALVKDCETCGPTYLNYNPWWGRGGMVDFTLAAAADYWHDYRRQALADMGINDHWADLGEPEQYNSTAWYGGFPELGKHSHADVHNIYGFRWMESIWRGYRRHQSAKRPFLLSRTGTSGIQRNGVGMWSGDIGTNWGNLRSQQNVQMHMSLSGIDYYGSDVGGFQRSRGGIDGGPERLYTEWFAASAALDVPVRPHAWNLDKARSTSPTERGEERSNLENLRQRYRLAPYYYSLAHQAHLTGEPVFPPLVYRYQADPKVRTLGSEKLIGKDLLVAVVAEPNAVAHDVYLPAGTWVDFHSGEWLRSDGRIFAGRPLYAAGFFQLPLFARAGAILPEALVDDETKNIRGRRADGSVASGMTFKIFAAEAASAFDLYEDDGESFGYENGQTSVTHLTQQLAGNQVSVTIGASVGQYTGMPTHRGYRLELAVEGRATRGADLGGRALPACSTAPAPCFANSASGVIVIELGNVSVRSAQVVTVDLEAAEAPRSNLFLSCANGQTSAGASVYAVGNVTELGAWDAARGLKMSAAAYPSWTLSVANLPANTAIEWKCVKRQEDGGGAAVWQSGANNQARTGASGFGGTSSGAF